MLLGDLKFDLIFHAALSVTTAVLLTLRYEDTNTHTNAGDDLSKFHWDHALSGAASAVSIVNALVSLLNYGKDELDGGCDANGKKKKRLESKMWNFGRNFFTSLTMVLIGFLYGYSDNNSDVLPPLIIIALLRLQDVALDCVNVLQIQCTDAEVTKNRFYRTAFAAVAMTTSIILFTIYVTDKPFDWEGENTADEVALTIGIIFLSIHLLLILLHVVLNIEFGEGRTNKLKARAVNWLRTDIKGENCKNVGVHLPNEIPLVSKLVFTITIGSFAIVVGERIAEGLDITNLLWILILLGASEMGGRNIV